MIRRGITIVLTAIVAVIAMNSLAAGTSFVTSATSGPRSLSVKAYEKWASVTITVEVTDGEPSAYFVQDYRHAANAGEGCETCRRSWCGAPTTAATSGSRLTVITQT